MGFTNFYITSAGRKLLAKGQTGTKINFTRMQIGTGILEPNTNIESLISLITPLKYLPMAGLEVRNKQAYIKGQFTNQNMNQFTWRELGLFAEDPTDGEILYAYSNAGFNADLIPAGSVSPIDFIFTMVINISNPNNISITIDNSLIFATINDLKDKMSFIVSNTTPTAKEGLLWYNPITDEQKTYLDGKWIEGGGSKLNIITSETQPTGTIKEGAYWYRLSTKELKLYINNEWILISSKDFIVAFNYERTFICKVQGTSNIPIGIPLFNPNTDILFVYQNGLKLENGYHFNLNNNNISIDLINYSLNINDRIQFNIITHILVENTTNLQELLDEKANEIEVNNHINQKISSATTHGLRFDEINNKLYCVRRDGNEIPFESGIKINDSTTSIETTWSSNKINNELNNKANKSELKSVAFTGYVEAGRKEGTIKGDKSTAEGKETIASGEFSHAGGYVTTASGRASCALGISSIASGSTSFAVGSSTIASGISSFSTGTATKATKLQFVTGSYNREIKNNEYDSMHLEPTDTAFIIGNGRYGLEGGSNCFRVQYDGGVYALKEYSSSGADYAEMFEWSDGNVKNQDRRGLFVSLDGDKIKLAKSTADIIGVISANPVVLGNNYSENWKDMYVRDIWGDIIYENKLIEEEIIDKNEQGELIKIKKQALRNVPKINSLYDSDIEYISRHKRKEWDAVGFLGQLIVIDDGTCEVGKRCKANDESKATISFNDEGYRVIKRLDSNHIKILASFL